MTFVTLFAAEISNKFVPAGFTKSVANTEVVYSRPHRDPRFTIKIYTSLTDGEAHTRSCGADAIRVCLVYTNPLTGKTSGVGKATRVNRVGTDDGVLNRTLERAREMWSLANQQIVCKHCGDLCWTDSGKCSNRACGKFNARRVAAPVTPPRPVVKETVVQRPTIYGQETSQESESMDLRTMGF